MFRITVHSYATHFNVYIFQKEYGIHLLFDRNYTGCGTARKRGGAEDMMFIEFSNS